MCDPVFYFCKKVLQFSLNSLYYIIYNRRNIETKGVCHEKYIDAACCGYICAFK